MKKKIAINNNNNNFKSKNLQTNKIKQNKINNLNLFQYFFSLKKTAKK